MATNNFLVTTKKNIFGLIGKNLEHSFSQKYFNQKFERENIQAEFLNFPVNQIEDLQNILQKNPLLKGISVTIPYKKTVIPFLNEIDHFAKQIGAVNSIKIRQKQGKTHLKGYNTDYYGFSESLKKFLKNTKLKALILGTGGAAKAVQKSLEHMKIEYRYVSRKINQANCLTYSDLNKRTLETYHLVINCTPLGTFPKTDQYPEIPYQYIGKNHYFYDLIYNPAETLFLKKAAEKKAKTHNGLEMLYLQAEKSWEIWNK